MQIDLNCDMGESFGTYELGYDAAGCRDVRLADGHNEIPRVCSHVFVELVEPQVSIVDAHR